MKRYEALFILHNPSKEDGIKETLDLITQEITNHSGQVETVQKMDRKAFTRVASKKFTSGFYANLIFQVPQGNLTSLRDRLSGLEGVFRIMITEGTTAAAPAAEPAPGND